MFTGSAVVIKFFLIFVIFCGDNTAFDEDVSNPLPQVCLLMGVKEVEAMFFYDS